MPAPTLAPGLKRALHGASLLACDAVAATTGIVEAMHATIAATPQPLGEGRQRTRGISRLVYASIQGINALVRRGADAGFGLLGELGEEGAGDPRAQGLRAALNGVLGDHLERSGNPLAARMQLRRDGRPLVLEAQALRVGLPQAGGRVAIWVHGLCMNELQWLRNGHSHPAMLEAGAGPTALLLHYNSGRHISDNGRELAELLERLLDAWPVELEELALVGHSMGGLVVRSAVLHGEQLGHRWCRRLRTLVSLGSPHHGAPAERLGAFVDAALKVSPYSAPLAGLGRMRSAGITDLRHGNLVAADWAGHARHERVDRRAAHALPQGVRCHAIAATRSPTGAPRPAGDGLVPVASALGRHRDPARALGFPTEHQLLVHEAGHFDLLDHPEVARQLCACLAPGPSQERGARRTYREGLRNAQKGMSTRVR